MASNSILTDVKGMLSLPPEVDDFDTILINHINGVFSYFHQIGLGPPLGFQIESGEETWDEYIVSPIYNEIKQLMYAKVRLLFDPPVTGAVINALQDQISELEWRLYAKQEVHGWSQLNLF